MPRKRGRKSKKPKIQSEPANTTQESTFDLPFKQITLPSSLRELIQNQSRPTAAPGFTVVGPYQSYPPKNFVFGNQPLNKSTTSDGSSLVTPSSTPRVIVVENKFQKQLRQKKRDHEAKASAQTRGRENRGDIGGEGGDFVQASGDDDNEVQHLLIPLPTRSQILGKRKRIPNLEEKDDVGAVDEDSEVEEEDENAGGQLIHVETSPYSPSKPPSSNSDDTRPSLEMAMLEAFEDLEHRLRAHRDSIRRHFQTLQRNLDTARSQTAWRMEGMENLVAVEIRLLKERNW